MNKSIFSSKTAWFNVLLGILPVIGTNIPALGFLADPQIIATFGAVGNIVLRFLTGQPVSVTGK